MTPDAHLLWCPFHIIQAFASRRRDNRNCCIDEIIMSDSFHVLDKASCFPLLFFSTVQTLSNQSVTK